MQLGLTCEGSLRVGLTYGKGEADDGYQDED